MHRDRHLWKGTLLKGWKRVGWPFAGLLLCACVTTSAYAVAYVRLDYSLDLPSRSRNTAFIELFDTDRPLTTANFLEYVNGNRYDNSLMHRLSRNFVVQGGGFYPDFQEEPFPMNVSLDTTDTVDRDGNPQTPNPTVMNEFANQPMRSNVRGTLAMAKQAGNPNSATNQWFVNLGNNAATLDGQNGGFTVFARVLGDGMTMFDTMNGVQIQNLNPDADNNGTRDSGPFGMSATDGLPMFQTVNANNQIIEELIILERAERIDYFSAGMTVNVNGGLNFTNRDAFFDTGTSLTGAGNITVGAQRTLGIRENFASGRLIVNQGILAPGLDLGSVTIGALNQAATGTLEIQLGGTTVNTGYDRLIVTNAAQIAGTLEVSLLDNFNPVHGNSFTILTAGSITGDFSTVELPMLDAGEVWNVNRTNTMLTLSVAAADFNRDGVVDTADYTLWQDTRGTTVTAFAGADADGNGMINNDDYTIWKNNFGNTRGGVPGSGAGAALAAAVPEPNTILLACCAVLTGLILLYRRRALAQR